MYTIKQIAEELHVSKQTIRKRMSKIDDFEKNILKKIKI